MRIDVLGAVTVANGDASVSGRALGGRRARVALVALGLSSGHVSAQRLADLLWPDDDLPPTWQVALRGVIRGLRTACAPINGDGQQLIVTQPAGYALASGVDIDIELASSALRNARELVKQGRHQAALALTKPVSQLSGSQLLPGEDAEWLGPHRRAVDELALRAVDLVVSAAGGIGDHDTAIAAARRAVAADALNERAHRALIAALDASGDRAGVVEAFERCRSLLADQLGVDPSPDTVQAYLAALGEQPGQSRARLPVIASTFVGREKELAELHELLRAPGLVTVTGLGGVGKSRLVLAAAASRAEFAGGRHWISLAPVSHDALVGATVAIQLGVAVGTSDASSALCDYLAPLGRTLLVLDGCEVVVDGVASLAAELLVACPHLTLVVTSRVPVSVDGEKTLAVRPFSAPSAERVDAFRSAPQVRLLLDRIRDGGGDLTIDDELAPDVAGLVRRCAGLPLALELVAAQLTVLPVGDLLDHLAGILPEGGLRSIAQGSYDMLDDDEATVFRRLAVLDGPAGLRLVRDVVSGGSIASVRVVRILRELTARGLVTVDRSGPRWRYQ
ncbi:MAG: BTAD domain-containing putative transcriptional regulator, partial [Acidothermaceae bacterium]